MTQAGDSARHVRLMRDLELWLVDLQSASGALEVREQCSTLLSNEEKQRAEAMAARPDDQRYWRAAHIALRLLIARWGGIETARMAYSFSSMGRPEIACAAFSFSLSHAGAAALIGLAPHGPIGVDLELPRPVKIDEDRLLQIEEHGQSLLPGVPLPSDPEPRFLQAWVRIEAAAKAEGIGVGRALTRIGVIGGEKGSHASTMTNVFEVRDVCAAPGLYAAVAAPKLPAILPIQKFPCDQAGIAGLFG